MLVTVLIAASLVVAGCSGDVGRPETGDDGVDGRLDGPLPGQPETTATSEYGVETEAAADTSTSGDRAASTPGSVAVAPRGDQALAEPLPGDPDVAPDVDPTFPAHDEPIAPAANPWQSTRTDPRSTFGLDVDTVSYGRIREAVRDGRSVDPTEVRIEEVVNALDYGYEPAPDQVFGVTADGAAWPWGRDTGTHLVRIGLATPTVEVRDPVDLVFVIDASGSMTSAMPDVQDALGVLVDRLEAGADRIAIVAYDTTARTVLSPTDAGDRDRVLGAIAEVSAGGSTNLGEGLAHGYDEAARMTETAGANTNTRVVLLSDGIANTGVTDLEGILGMVAGGVDSGTELLTVGFGMGGFNDPLMEQLADRGDGRAVYVDTPDQARELFGEQLAGTLQTVAIDARSQVEFDPDVVDSYRLLGYDNRAIADERFRDDTVDAGEIGAGHTVTALYEVDLRDAVERPADRDVVARVHLRWLDPDTRDATEIAADVTLADIASGWESAPAGLRLAGTAAAWAEVLRLSPYAPSGDPAALSAEARRIADSVGSEQLLEWADLVSRSLDT